MIFYTKKGRCSFMKNIINKTISALKQNGMNGYFVDSTEELLKTISTILKKGDTVACGGSLTLYQTGILKMLSNGQYNYLDRFKKDISPKELKQIFRDSFSADVYLTGTNAITITGELYNVDGNGNRVACMMYGPDKVIVVCSINKIVDNLQEAMERNRSIAAPLNAARLSKNTPCVKLGYCVDCSSSDRICCKYTLISKERTPDRMHVILIQNDYGF